MGLVQLVGAGPGDPGLLTLHAARALGEAEVVLHDRLVSAEVLRLSRRDATRIEVGKSAGRHSMSQDDIHALMLEHARNLEFEKAAQVRDQLSLPKERAFGAHGTDNVVILPAGGRSV